MTSGILIKNVNIVNEGKIQQADIIIRDEIIEDIVFNNQFTSFQELTVIDGQNLYALPGIIDDQVHFRQPGLEHKADIYTESKAAVAGGVTSYMEMPNTVPPTITQELLEAKYKTASDLSLANYSFYMGVTNNNADEVLKTPLDDVCGIKIFLGSSTGNLLVNKIDTIEKIFSKTKHIVAVHCEDDDIINQNLLYYKRKFGSNIPISYHHLIRNEESCLKSSYFAVELAKKHKTRLHILHLSTLDELSLLDNLLPIEQKHITAEACVHHLWFTSDDYEKYGAKIKWNPAIKNKKHREALRKALLSGLIDVVATDHAPHLLNEKNNLYELCPSGAPIIQHSLLLMLELVKKNIIPLHVLVQLMCHNPAKLFQIHKRGFIRKGYYADLVLLDLEKETQISQHNIYSKCKWSPIENQTLSSRVVTTIVNGHIVYNNGIFNETKKGKRLQFDRS